MIIRPDPRMGLRALTVRQPYASQILAGTKDVEFRDWKTPYRGDLLITVASKRTHHPGPYASTLCVVELYGVADHGEGPEWLLRNPRAVPVVAVKGWLKLWSPPEDLVAQLGLEVAPLQGAAARGME